MAGKRTGGFKPGERVERSGQYVEVGPRGGLKNEVTVVRGERFPPTGRAGSSFRLVDPSRNKAGRGR